MHKSEPSSKMDAAAEGRSLTVAALLGGENASIGAATVRERFPDRLRYFHHSLATPPGHHGQLMPPYAVSSLALPADRADMRAYVGPELKSLWRASPSAPCHWVKDSLTSR